MSEVMIGTERKQGSDGKWIDGVGQMDANYKRLL